MIKFRLFKSKKKEEAKEELPEAIEEIVETEPLEKVEEPVSQESNVQIIEEKKEESFVSTPTDYYETLTSSDTEETKMVETKETKEWTRRTWEDLSEIERIIDEMKIERTVKKETDMEKKIDRILSKSK